MSLQAKTIAALVAFIALAGAVLGYGHYHYAKGVRTTTDHYEAALGAQKADASARLADEIAKTRAAEQALQARRDQQETQDAEHQKTVADLSASLRAAAGQSGRLRDPNARGCGPGGGGAPGAPAPATADRPADAAEAGGPLSAQLTGLLQRLTREADDINDAYASCRGDAYSVRGIAPPP